MPCTGMPRISVRLWGSGILLQRCCEANETTLKRQIFLRWVRHCTSLHSERTSLQVLDLCILYMFADVATQAQIWISVGTVEVMLRLQLLILA